MKKGLWPEKGTLWFLFLIVGIVSVPLMTDYVMEGSSLRASLNQIEVIGQGLGKVFPVRVCPLGTLDYGYSAASLQANLCYLFPAMLYLAGVNLINAYKWTVFLFNVVTAVIAYGSFRAVCSKREIGLLCSALYTWCPYRCSQVYLEGDMGEIATWAFLPMIISGLKLLYMSDERENNKKAYTFLVCGYSLTLVSSTVVFFAAAVLTFIFLLAMGRRTWTKSRLRILCKSAGTVILLNAWFLVPVLSRLSSDDTAVAVVLLPDIRSRGMYLLQYFNTYSWGGADGTELVQNGLAGAQAMGPGIAVILLILLSILYLHCGRRNDVPQSSQAGKSAGRLLGAGVCLMVLSSHLFPWDLLQDKSWLCSAILSLMYTPAKLGIAADACLITAAGMLLAVLSEKLNQKYYLMILWAAGAVSCLTTQFMLGQIMVSRQFIRLSDWEIMERLPFVTLERESALWRSSELVSAVTLAVCAAVWVVRRRRVVKGDKSNQSK